jgi:hypothetical protein
MRKSAKTQRNEKILKLIHEGETYESIGKKFGISKQRVRQFAVANGVSRWKEIREFKQKKYKDFLPDIKANLTVEEIAVKHSLTKAEVRSIYKEKTGKNLNEVLLEKRNETITKKFLAGKTARKITLDPTKVLDNPQRVSSLNHVYQINTKNNVRRYPEVGDRSKGGTSQSKKAIKLIVKYRDKGFTYTKILKKLNKKSIKTVTGLEFKVANIRQLYCYTKTKLNK